LPPHASTWLQTCIGNATLTVYQKILSDQTQVYTRILTTC